MFADKFVDETPVEFEIEGEKFKYKPITADDELEWAPEYIDEVQTEEGIKRIPNMKRLTKCQLRSIIEVPMTREQIKEKTGIDKEFKDLTKEEKDMFWGKMEPDTVSNVVKKLKEVSNVKKN